MKILHVNEVITFADWTDHPRLTFTYWEDCQLTDVMAESRMRNLFLEFTTCKLVTSVVFKVLNLRRSFS